MTGGAAGGPRRESAFGDKRDRPGGEAGGRIRRWPSEMKSEGTAQGHRGEGSLRACGCKTRLLRGLYTLALAKEAD